MHTKLTGNKKRATGFDGMPLQNELNSDVARSTTHVRTCLAINKVARFVLVGGKTRSSYRPTDGPNIQTQTPYLAFHADLLWVL